MDIKNYAAELGLVDCIEFDPSSLVPEETIRAYCREDKCGSWGKNYTCPPHSGTLEEIQAKISTYSHAVLLRYSKQMEVSLKNINEVARTKNEFHEKVLKVEEYLQGQGIEHTFAMIGGSCELCEICAAATDESCRFPDKARVSPESSAIDVGKLLESVGLKLEFQPDRLTWTGFVLYSL